MKINTTSPVEEAITEIATDLENGANETDPWQNPAAGLAIKAGQNALAGLRAVLDALGDLEPGPALIVNDALREGLGVTW